MRGAPFACADLDTCERLDLAEREAAIEIEVQERRLQALLYGPGGDGALASFRVEEPPARYRAGEASPSRVLVVIEEDYSDGTFTISNLGMLGVDQFYAIITPPQSTVLSVGALRHVPVVGPDGALRPGHRMDFGLGCDHRVLDGAKAARFLGEIRRILESPEELLRNGGDA